MNLEDQYDRIFKYLYFHLHDRHMAEDLTQEAELSGGTCLICHNRDSGAVDWPAEI